MVKGIILTERDSALLFDCYSNTTLSFSQIHKRHFKNASVPTVSNRLSKLQKGKYLEKKRVGIILYERNPEEIGNVYRVTKKAIHYLRLKYPEEAFRDEPVAFNAYALSHDLLLTDVISQLRNLFSGRRIVNGRLYFDHRERPRRLPDAVVLDTNGKPEVAIELELNSKSEKRYYEIVMQYRLASQFQKVLYVVGNNAIAEKIKNAIAGRKVNTAHGQIDTGKFSFVTLSQVLKSQLEAA